MRVKNIEYIFRRDDKIMYISSNDVSFQSTFDLEIYNTKRINVGVHDIKFWLIYKGIRIDLELSEEAINNFTNLKNVAPYTVITEHAYFSKFTVIPNSMFLDGEYSIYFSYLIYGKRKTHKYLIIKSKFPQSVE
ncbi:MAG: hypothetical protein F8N38_06230 [Hungatella sp.]|nr:hypothetical protein [Hungatella sp.]